MILRNDIHFQCPFLDAEVLVIVSGAVWMPSVLLPIPRNVCARLELRATHWLDVKISTNAETILAVLRLVAWTSPARINVNVLGEQEVILIPQVVLVQAEPSVMKMMIARDNLPAKTMFVSIPAGKVSNFYYLAHWNEFIYQTLKLQTCKNWKRISW